MANNSIDIIIKMATELKAKMGEDEKQIPAWIQDHIAKAENLISQASGNYHEYGDSNESVNEEIKEKDWKTIYNVFVKFLKANTKALEIRVMMRDEAATKKAIESIISGLTNAQRSLKLESVNEAPKKLKHTISKKEWSKIPKYNKHIGMDGVHYIMKYDDKIGTYLQGVQIVDESIKEASGRVPQIFLKTGAVEKKIKELMADRKKAVVPYNTEKDPKKKEILKQILIKLTKQIQGYEKNLVQLRDKEEEYIQQMQADAELDTSAFA
jgi:flagellar biosynthesis chaperone FliJ